MAEGWLWLSMRMATAMPSPASITPAFSPGPTSTRGPSVGRRRRCSREDLYEQCSLHITAYRANSRWLGGRPRILPTASNSSSVRPNARWSGSSAGGWSGGSASAEEVMVPSTIEARTRCRERAGTVWRSVAPIGPHDDEIVLGPQRGGLEAGLFEPVQLVGQGGRP